MKYLVTLLTLILFQVSVFAHEGGHGNSKIWIVNDKPVEAEFLKYEDEKVYFLNKGHTLLTYDLEALSPKQQKLILEKNTRIFQINKNESKTSSFSNSFFIGISIFLLLLSIALYSKDKKRFHLAYGFFAIIVLMLTACKKDDDFTDSASLPSIPANNVAYMQSIFGNFSTVGTSTDNTYFHVSSNGIPSHDMMVGITNWQQQIPIDHAYTGTNSWAIPIQPELSENPLSTQTNLLKGAIAIGVNGIPIFNPLNNRGEDAYAIGELDQWGGHCGRADDYHYHLPPTHLQSTVGEGNPIAYAVDGFPVYGETTDELDEYLGKFNADGSYQYHTVTNYPYLIAGMRGKVTLDPNTTAPENQVIPQAMTQGVRPALEPLNGAAITSFQSTGTNSYSLVYSLNNQNYTINYGWDNTGLYTYEFVDPSGNSTIETYKR